MFRNLEVEDCQLGFLKTISLNIKKKNFYYLSLSSPTTITNLIGIIKTKENRNNSKSRTTGHMLNKN